MILKFGNFNYTKSLLGIETLRQVLLFALALVNFNYTKSLLGIETNFEAINEDIKENFNYTKSLLGIETKPVFFVHSATSISITQNPY